jgi:hypothetical protein
MVWLTNTADETASAARVGDGLISNCNGPATKALHLPSEAAEPDRLYRTERRVAFVAKAAIGRRGVSPLAVGEM